jgi:hypothetical protein
LDAGEHGGSLAESILRATREKSSQFPAKRAVLEGGEEGVQFGEVGALRGLLPLDGFDDGGEFLLEGKRGEWDFYS